MLSLGAVVTASMALEAAAAAPLGTALAAVEAPAWQQQED